MDNLDYSAIGQRIKALRKRKGYNQQELADIIGKSLRTVQKYESGEIEVSIAVVNQLAEVLETTPTFILGYDTDIAPIRSLADVMNRRKTATETPRARCSEELDSTVHRLSSVSHGNCARQMRTGDHGAGGGREFARRYIKWNVIHFTTNSRRNQSKK